MTSADIGLIVAASVQAIATIALVSITIFYAISTKKQASEMRMQRLESKPFVIPDIDYGVGSTNYVEDMKDIAQGKLPIIITNVGDQAATELELLVTTPKSKVFTERIPLLIRNGQYRTAFIITEDLDENGFPIFGLPPKEGLYKLTVKFSSPSPQVGTQPTEVSLPFALKWSGDSFWWNIQKHDLEKHFPND